MRLGSSASVISTMMLFLLNQGLSAFAADPSLIPKNQHAQTFEFEAQPSSAQEELEEVNRRLQETQTVPEVAPESTAPPSSPINPAFDQYRLGPGDAFFANVRRFPEASFQATLDLQGNVVIPLAGVINLQGLTLQQAEARIQSELERFFISPDVGVTVVAQRPVAVTILGEVARPGLHPLPNPQISTALFSAGGTTRLANLRTIQIRRPIRDQTGAVVNTIEQNIDLFTPLSEATDLPDIQLADGDVIIVPTLTAQEIEQYDRTLIARSTLAQPEINVRLLDYTRGLRNLTIPSGSDFLDALTSTGTDLTNADLSDIALIRFDPQHGAYIAQEIDAKDALRGDLSQNPTLEDEDIVIIGRNLVARISFFFTRVAQPIRDPLQFLFLFDTIVDFVGGEEN
ncbi:MAG: polysaccharide biosynthesis/export family protein [Elainellaceae cyanobacterium]